MNSNEGPFIKRQTSDRSSDNAWQRVTMRGTTSGNKLERVRTSGKTNDSELQRVVQRATTSDNK